MKSTLYQTSHGVVVSTVQYRSTYEDTLCRDDKKTSVHQLRNTEIMNIHVR